MVAVTYGAARVAVPADKTAGKGLGFFARFLAAFERAQMQRAERDLMRYRHLLPLDHELRGSLVPRSQDKLPFGGL